MFGPAQRAVAMAVEDCVEDGTIPVAEADNIFICVGVFIHCSQRMTRNPGLQLSGNKGL
jgi:formaldehyde-activating enzyme